MLSSFKTQQPWGIKMLSSFKTQQPWDILERSENLRLGIKRCSEESSRSESIKHTPKSENNRNIYNKTAIK